MKPLDTHIDITHAEFAQFQQLIYQIAGISLADTKKVLLVVRLEKRLKALGLKSFGDYFKLISSGAQTAERQTMVDLLTTNETYFFREESHFDFLRQIVLPQRTEGRSFDIWSAASSTGEEIYTLCMVLADELGANGHWTILGSDINTHVLNVAQKAVYRTDRTRGLPDRYRHQYCVPGDDADAATFQIAPALRKHASFRQINLNTHLPNIGKFDVIFLRNVMIYFDSETKRMVAARLVEKLRPGGYLIIGHSESLNGINDTVKLVQPTIYRLPE